MLTVFERIPDLFVQHYDMSFQTWAREFRARGAECAIPFDRPPNVPAVLDAEGRAIFRGAWLVADVDRSLPQQPRVVIRPKDEASQAAIERHTAEMARHWVS